MAAITSNAQESQLYQFNVIGYGTVLRICLPLLTTAFMLKRIKGQVPF